MLERCQRLPGRSGTVFVTMFRLCGVSRFRRSQLHPLPADLTVRQVAECIGDSQPVAPAFWHPQRWISRPKRVSALGQQWSKGVCSSICSPGSPRAMLADECLISAKFRAAASTGDRIIIPVPVQQSPKACVVRRSRPVSREASIQKNPKRRPAAEKSYRAE